MKSKIALVFIAGLLLVGCGASSKVQDVIDEALDKKETEVEEVVDNTITEEEAEQTNTINLQSEAQAVVDRHNEIRAKVFSGATLQWSDQVATDAQDTANTLVQRGVFDHLGLEYANGPYGENLYTSTLQNVSLTEAVDAWNLEAPFYDYASNSCSANSENIDGVRFDSCGHYTQIIWKETSYVGCAKANYANGDILIVCKYKTPGNYIGQKPY
ncbi:MAG: hypothetical protein K0U47_08425 [Epsilonproteobacteria bacterium]|nr:hypothetical protein [Campylobacterota bacterium]